MWLLCTDSALFQMYHFSHRHIGLCMYVCVCGGWRSCIFQRRCLTSDIDVCKIARLLLSFSKDKRCSPPACSRSQQAENQPAAGLLPRHYLIGEGVSLPRNTERPFVLRRCPGSDIRWRLHPSGSARRRRDPARSSRPVTTKDTWRSVDPGKRWVLPGVAAMLSGLRVVFCERRSGCGCVCVCWTTG